MTSSAIAAATVFFGSGYLLPMNDGTVFSLSARAHHIGHVHTLSTTEAFERGILNTRREPHGEDHARMHLIPFDYTLAGAAMLGSLVQCIFAAAEEGFCGLGLYDPVRALRIWSWSLDLRTGRLPATAALVDGRNLTLPQYMRELCQRLLAMCEAGLITPAVAPEATEMLPRIIELTHYLEEGAIDRCAKHLDWAAKLLYLLGSQQNWGDAASRLADHDFTNTDPERGAFWRLWREGLIDPLIDLDDAQACLNSPPPESRAWARGELVRKFADDIRDVNWSCVELHRPGGGRWSRRLTIELPHLDSLRRERFAPLLNAARDVEHLERLLDEEQRGESDPIENVTPHLATPE
jgi:proteasome accessory factor A